MTEKEERKMWRKEFFFCILANVYFNLYFSVKFDIDYKQKKSV